ncbi:MAG: CooT family nickel-binding protein [archaeon GB-1867-035]|nr:CooT family nickel-binding protein [Candidatus Culexmicrobium profundum]
MCEFKLRVYLNDGGEMKLINREAITVKFEGDGVSIFSDDGSTLKVKDAVISEVNAERQIVILSRRT